MYALTGIKNRVVEMEKNGKVNIAILEDLKEFNDKILAIEKKWTIVEHNDGFYFYQAACNVELILEKMMDRFRTAKEKHDNSQIALDTLELIPIIENIVKITDDDYELEENNVKIVDKLLEYTRDLRDKAAVHNLVENDSRNMIDMDAKTLGKTYEKIMERIDVPSKLPPVPNTDDDHST